MIFFWSWAPVPTNIFTVAFCTSSPPPPLKFPAPLSLFYHLRLLSSVDAPQPSRLWRTRSEPVRARQILKGKKKREKGRSSFLPFFISHSISCIYDRSSFSSILETTRLQFFHFFLFGMNCELYYITIRMGEYFVIVLEEICKINRVQRCNKLNRSYFYMRGKLYFVGSRMS